MLQEGVYFQRIRFDLTDMVVGTANKAVLERAIAEVADRFGMEWRLFYDGAVKRVAILVSRLDHCLYDILIRHRAGESLSRAEPYKWQVLSACEGFGCLLPESSGSLYLLLAHTEKCSCRC